MIEIPIIGTKKCVLALHKDRVDMSSSRLTSLWLVYFYEKCFLSSRLLFKDRFLYYKFLRISAYASVVARAYKSALEC